jgi:hypothetical protein
MLTVARSPAEAVVNAPAADVMVAAIVVACSISKLSAILSEEGLKIQLKNTRKPKMRQTALFQRGTEGF